MSTPQAKTQRERGQAVVLVALMALTLVAFAGLALDGAQTYQMRRRMQNAADAGSAAGARELGQGSSYQIISSKINTYTIGGNGVGNGADTYEGVFLPSGNNVKTTAPASGDNCVQVTSHITFSTIMIGLLPGFDTLPAKGVSKACVGPIVASTTELWPMVIHTPTVPYALNQTFVITFVNPNQGSDYQPGTFGWVTFNGCKTNACTDTWINTPYVGQYSISDYSGTCNGQTLHQAPMLSIGDWLPGNPGGSNPAIVTSLDAHKGMTETILFYDNAGCSGNSSVYHIVGFGRVLVQLVCFKNNEPGCPSSNDNKLYVQFLKFVAPGQICLSNCYFQTGVTGVSYAP